MAADETADSKTQEISENMGTQENSEKPATQEAAEQSGDNKDAPTEHGGAESEPEWVKCWDNISQVNFVIIF